MITIRVSVEAFHPEYWNSIEISFILFGISQTIQLQDGATV